MSCRGDIEFGIQNDIDFVAASFVRKPEDVVEIRSFIEEMSQKYWPKDYPRAQIISKIENLQVRAPPGIVNDDK